MEVGVWRSGIRIVVVLRVCEQQFKQFKDHSVREDGKISPVSMCTHLAFEDVWKHHALKERFVRESP